MTDRTLINDSHINDSHIDDSLTSYTITNVRAVLPDRIADAAVVVVEDGLIVAVHQRPTTHGPVVDGAGLLLLPGLVDTHSDGLEKEIHPRRNAQVPIDYALGSFEGRLRSAGITTVFHGLAYQERPQLGRSITHAREIDALIDQRRADDAAAVDHRVLYRIEARDAHAVDPLLCDLERERDGEGPHQIPPLVSFEDHTPGQGQYRDVAQFAAAVDPSELPEGMTLDTHLQQLVAEAERHATTRDHNLALLTPLARAGRIRLLAHDADTAEAVQAAFDAGASVAEFPVSVEAAQAARHLGMPIVMGAPNALRGHSHSGNTSARDLVAQDLCDVIASDYLPSALIACAFELVAAGCCSLVHAVGLITSGPAAVAGLDDRGRIAIGAVADLILVNDKGRWPSVVGMRRAADGLERRVLVG